MSRIAVYSLVGICFLNLNGWGYMFLDREQMFSPVLALAVAMLLWTLRASASLSAVIYASWVAYFVATGIFVTTLLTGNVQWGLVAGAIGNALVVIAVASWFEHASDAAVARALMFAFSCTFLSGAIVLSSPYFEPLIVNRISDVERNSGFFANPNEAGEVCLIGLCLSFAIRGPLIRWVMPPAVCVLVLAALSSFSKASAIGLLALGALLVYRRFGALSAGIASGFAIILTSSLSVPNDGYVPLLGIELEPMQAVRIEQLASTFRGEVDEFTTTNRTVVWAAAADKIEHGGLIGLIFGNGLGSFRSIEGGLWENGEWKGVHNTWFMILGEGGIIALIPLAVLFLVLVRRSTRVFKNNPFPLLYCVAFIVDTFSSHNALELKFHAIGLAIAISLVGRMAKFSGSQRAAHSPTVALRIQGQ